MPILQKFAPVKVNLCLHVGPVRRDGLHELASIAVFPEIGDILNVSPADNLSLEVTGPFADQLTDLPPEKNLVIKAARLLQEASGTDEGADLMLQKSVPPASGIGGGTSDAAAAFILLRELWKLSTTDNELFELAFELGADGPVSLMPHLQNCQSVLMRGAGEIVDCGPQFPPLWMCLVNPLRDVPTGDIFRIFDADNPTPAKPDLPQALEIRSFLLNSRNDLQESAVTLCPDIAIVLRFIEATKECIGVRMSGSGATCFGLYVNAETAQDAQNAARENGWWAASGMLK